jgi:hypothetical protein
MMHVKSTLAFLQQTLKIFSIYIKGGNDFIPFLHAG